MRALPNTCAISSRTSAGCFPFQRRERRDGKRINSHGSTPSVRASCSSTDARRDCGAFDRVEITGGEPGAIGQLLVLDFPAWRARRRWRPADHLCPPYSRCCGAASTVAGRFSMAAAARCPWRAPQKTPKGEPQASWQGGRERCRDRRPSPRFQRLYVLVRRAACVFPSTDGVSNVEPLVSCFG